MNNSTDRKRKRPKYYDELAYRHTLSIDEAAWYFGIGENKFRQLVKENDSAEWIFHIGSRTRIIRSLFEQFMVQEQAV